MFRSFAVGLVALSVLFGASFAQEVNDKLDYTVRKIDGQEISLADYQGKVLLIVNVASRCGLTPQYKQLQALHEEYKDEGFAVLGFPCNQFGGQEPGTPEQIQEFCSTKYNVSFDLFEKIQVNGGDACDLYKHLTSLDTEPAGKGDITWNFEKFLVSRDGKVVARFSPRTKPDSEEVVSAIKRELANNG